MCHLDKSDGKSYRKQVTKYKYMRHNTDITSTWVMILTGEDMKYMDDYTTRPR
jgi:hypothetical protein